MRRSLWSVLFLFLIALLFAPGAFAANQAIPIGELPPAVRDALTRAVDDYGVRAITKTVRDGQTVYNAEARGRQSRRLDIALDESGRIVRQVYEMQFNVQNGRLMWEGRPYTIQSFYTPEAGDPQQAPRALIEAVSRFSDVGGNVLAMDLFGLNPDGRGFTPEADAFYQKTIDRLIYTKISGIIRVFPKNAPQDLGYRYNAVRTTAEYFKKENQFIFWIDGPQDALLARAFKAIAPGLMVAAPDADLIITQSLKTENTGKPVIRLLSSLPNEFPDGHFLLTDRKANYAAFDRAKAWPEESQSWNPDNAGLSESEKKEGFVSLFDGKTTNGWLPLSRGGKGFIVRDGTLQRQPNGGSIRTIRRFGDFVLRLDFQIESNGNSGVQVRCPRANRQSKIGFEVQILGDYGKTPTPDSTGAIYNVIAPTANASKPGGEWNAMDIECQGSKVRVIVNGQTVQDIDFDDYDELKYRLRNGFIILTDHGNFAAYRNIRIKEL